jgi:hypothetical protein
MKAEYKIKTIYDFVRAYSETDESKQELMLKDFKSFLIMLSPYLKNENIVFKKTTFYWLPNEDNDCVGIKIKCEVKQ